MNSRALLSYGLSALVLGVSVAGVGASAIAPTAASARESNEASRAAHDADAAREALADGRAQRAVPLAESAVAGDPRNAEYRALLGQAYLLSGRFVSAGEALDDALTLTPDNGRVALHLALAQIAQGHWDDALDTLDDHADVIPASDRGLAIALAGDPVDAVRVLTLAARAPGANAKTRQNLALAYALAGRWREARAIAAVDLRGDRLEARMSEWATFARPTNAYDQVASLLGVRAIEDAGQPERLALSRTTAPDVALASAEDAYRGYATETAMPASNANSSANRADAGEEDDTAIAARETAPFVTQDYAVQAPVQAAPASAGDAATARIAVPAEVRTLPVTAPVAPPLLAADPAPQAPARPMMLADAAPVTPVTPSVIFGPRREIVQPIAMARPAVTARAAAPRVADTTGEGAARETARAAGNYYVQLGAYENAAVARDGWARIRNRHAALRAEQPQGVQVTTRNGTFYRLSVGGFTRAQADALCRGLRSAGGNCFVRAGAGDRLASWVRGEQLAAR